MMLIEEETQHSVEDVSGEEIKPGTLETATSKHIGDYIIY